MPHFTFETELTKGRYERVYPVDVTYEVRADGTVDVTDWRCEIALGNGDVDTLADIAAERAEQDVAEYEADKAEHYAELRRDVREAA